MLEPQEGQVLVDNNDIKKNKKGWFKIGYVPQAVYLNDDTIKNNIYFYEDKYINNLKKLKNSVKISQLKKIGLNRKVGEEEFKYLVDKNKELDWPEHFIKNLIF